MKRIGLGIVALGLSLSALTVGAKAANAAQPCAPAVTVQPAGYGYGYYGNERARELRLREQQRLERQREEARRRWQFNNRDRRY